MRGDSFLANLKRNKKVLNETEKRKIFEKVTRRIIFAANTGGTDPEVNLKLRTAMMFAKDAKLPKAQLNEALNRAASGVNFKEAIFEAFAPGNIGLIVEAITDNVERALIDVKDVLRNNGGSLANKDFVTFMFKNMGLVTYPSKVKPEETMMDLAIEAGANDCVQENDEYEITCDINSLYSVRDYLEKNLGPPTSANLIWKPNRTDKLESNKIKDVITIINNLEDLDDVQSVWSSLDIPKDYSVKDKI